MSLGFVGRVYSSIKGFYNEINSATLTGAIDVIIVKQADGTYLSSPFHVRFGKLGVLRSREKVVDIEINGQSVDLHMKLGDAGEAFFVCEVEDEEENEGLEYLATSPIISAKDLMKQGLAKLKEEAECAEQSATAIHHETQPDSDFDKPILVSTPTPSSSLKEIKLDLSYKEKSKEKPRRKVLKKKKQKTSSKASPRSQSLPEGLGLESDLIFEMEFTDTSDDEEVIAYNSGANRSLSFNEAVLKKADDIREEPGEEDGIFRTERQKNSLEAFLTPFSDPEITPPQSPLPTRPPSPKSDTEVDRQHAEQSQHKLLSETSPTWSWGEFPKQTPVNSPDKDVSREHLIESMLERENSENVSSGGLLSILSKQKAQKKAQSPLADEGKGMYLDDLASLDDPELAKLYLGNPRFVSIRDREDDSESGRGASLPQSPHSVEGAIGGPVSFLESEVRHLGVVSLSLCGGLSDAEGITLDKFMQKVVTYDDLAEQPSLLNNPDLVVKIRDQYYNWTTASPMVVAEMAFSKPLPEPTITSLVKEHMPKKLAKKKGSGLSWFSWRRSTVATAGGGADDLNMHTTSAQRASIVVPMMAGAGGMSDNEGNSSKLSESSMSPVGSPATSPPTSVHSTPRKSSRQKEADLQSTETDTDNSEKETSSMQHIYVKEEPTHQEQMKSLTLTMEETQEVNMEEPRGKYRKTLRLSTEHIGKLNLREGQNEIVYSVTTQYQGTTRCVSHVYLWNHDDRIVISDIDGTITKSDVLGQILPIIGRDWSQSGVAQLFTRLSNNGYKLIYLSARAIGQSRLTKDLLRSIKQGDRVLPDGPLLLNPISLISAFHREVIVKNPEEFKISCLRDIAGLFPASPFYAGFGNKINDVIAYRALDIPSFRIFTINPQGQLRHDLTHTFLSSYSRMSDIADHFFPPISLANRGMSNEYSNVTYWRQPVSSVDQLDIELLKKEDATQAAGKKSTVAGTTAISAAVTAPPATALSVVTTAPPSEDPKKTNR
ncbi:LOW QUALITY PROTEIN: phosphatidate phosphatase LPIN1-like [Pomacea canaliculata]|uniref:LOW QUALITY PROTEIN: phosphatidate phosphatase LPIN1-like n=1 Tax=Pomacea canaliculata TaxID=400727 RepID=UPI000D73FAA9|nr:LOW QUALITY PROTEIN: phosphatidate phosphatase LPIN1-like [Pomacea canaliculata]